MARWNEVNLFIEEAILHCLRIDVVLPRTSVSNYTIEVFFIDSIDLFLGLSGNVL